MARIALDIDSTLHHYWDLIDRISRERYGVELPYQEQTDWGITLLERDQLIAVVEETHSDDNVLSAEPYPGAVETVKAWREQGHWIHVTSHRTTRAYAATEEWLKAVGIPCDDLHCSFDKITRCVELDIDVLIDDSPVNLRRARAEGMVAATIVHPWNRHLVDSDGILGASDWAELRRRLEPVLRNLA